MNKSIFLFLLLLFYLPFGIVAQSKKAKASQADFKEFQNRELIIVGANLSGNENLFKNYWNFSKFGGYYTENDFSKLKSKEKYLVVKQMIKRHGDMTPGGFLEDKGEFGKHDEIVITHWVTYKAEDMKKPVHILPLPTLNNKSGNRTDFTNLCALHLMNNHFKAIANKGEKNKIDDFTSTSHKENKNIKLNSNATVYLPAQCLAKTTETEAYEKKYKNLKVINLERQMDGKSISSLLDENEGDVYGIVTVPMKLVSKKTQTKTVTSMLFDHVLINLRDGTIIYARGSQFGIYTGSNSEIKKGDIENMMDYFKK
jgi:hypothetical protein